MASEFDIDQYNLDKECRTQADRRYQWGVKLANATKEHELAKAELEITEAELDREIRLDPESFGISKMTEGGVRAAIVNSKRFQKATSNLINARHALDIAKAGSYAMSDRKDNLSDLVRLWIAEYYGDPKVPREAREKLKEEGDRKAFTKGLTKKKKGDDE